MKSIKIIALFISYLLLAAPVFASGAAEKGFTLLYQSDFKGYVEGCG